MFPFNCFLQNFVTNLDTYTQYFVKIQSAGARCVYFVCRLVQDSTEKSDNAGACHAINVLRQCLLNTASIPEKRISFCSTKNMYIDAMRGTEET